MSSSLERLAQARTDWTERRFPVVPGDAVERMEAPEALGHPVDASAHRPGGA